jgi:hypothetical protein
VESRDAARISQLLACREQKGEQKGDITGGTKRGQGTKRGHH